MWHIQKDYMIGLVLLILTVHILRARALNMDPATIVGQLRPDYSDASVDEAMGNKNPFAEAWEGKFGSTEYKMVMEQDTADEIVVEWEDALVMKYLLVPQIYKKIF